MSDPNNNGSRFYNKNSAKSFNQVIDTNLVQLSSFTCSEVDLINKASVAIFIYDNNNFDDSNRLALSANDTYTLKGVTNCSSVSAKSAGGSGLLYYRANSYSTLNQY